MINKVHVAAVSITLAILLIIVAWSVALGYAITKGVSGIEKNGLRHYIERVWNGPE